MMSKQLMDELETVLSNMTSTIKRARAGKNVLAGLNKMDPEVLIGGMQPVIENLQGLAKQLRGSAKEFADLMDKFAAVSSIEVVRAEPVAAKDRT
jgi:hypothetical protein